MKIILFTMLTALFFCGCETEDSGNLKRSGSLKDDLNREIVFDQTPERVISLAPNLTEMIYLMESGDKLVGNTTFCNYPAEANNVEKVGDLISYNYEKIVSLKPDLVILTVEGNTKQGFDKLIDLGMKVFVSNPRNFEGIKKSFSDLAVIFGKDSSAAKIVSGWDQTVDSISNSAKKQAPQTAMFLIELHPVMVAGSETFINEYINLCGLKNIVSDSPQNYPVLNREEIVTRNPDLIIYPDDGNTTESEIISSYPEWKELNAVKNNKIIFADRDIYFRPGPRFIVALRDFYKKVFAEKN